MKHEEAVQYTNEQNGSLWGGYSTVTPAILAAWIEHWRKVFEEYEVDILRYMAKGGDSVYDVVAVQEPLGYSAYGLLDTEGRFAVEDYMLARAQLL